MFSFHSLQNFNITVPKNIKFIVFINFDINIDMINLPHGIVSIEFGDKFNISIDKIVFPKTLQSIHFGKSFNQPINNHTIFPDCCYSRVYKSVIFGDDFDQSPLKISFIGNVHSLSLSQNYNQLYLLSENENIDKVIIGNIDITKYIRNMRAGDTQLESINMKLDLLTDVIKTIKKDMKRYDDFIEKYEIKKQNKSHDRYF